MQTVDAPPPLAEKSVVAFPRRIDHIATQAQGQFVLSLGVALVVALVWAALTEIDKVTRGSGRIVPQQHKQLVQHLEGGIVAEILVREGDKVAAGQPLMRIENSFFRSELAQAAIEIAAKRLRLVRLEAESAGAKEVFFPRDLTRSQPQAVENEAALFQRRRANLDEQLSILTQQARQKEIELSELRSREPSVLRERQIAEERLASLKKLMTAGAVSRNDALEAERVLQQAITRLSDLAHDIPRAEASLAEIEQRKRQVASNFQADAEKDRTQTSTEAEKLAQGVAAMQDRSRRSDVVSSVAGVINKLNVTTIGGVVKPGEALAEIVPGDASISVEMKLSPAGAVRLSAPVSFFGIDAVKAGALSESCGRTAARSIVVASSFPGRSSRAFVDPSTVDGNVVRPQPLRLSSRPGAPVQGRELLSSPKDAHPPAAAAVIAIATFKA